MHFADLLASKDRFYHDVARSTTLVSTFLHIYIIHVSSDRTNIHLFFYFFCNFFSVVFFFFFLTKLDQGKAEQTKQCNTFRVSSNNNWYDTLMGQLVSLWYYQCTVCPTLLKNQSESHHKKT